MSLLRDIQEASINSSVDLTVVLRKCKVLAVRLGNEDFVKWVEAELNGYENIEDLPPYRILEVNSKGHFSGSFGSGLRNADIPIFCFPKNFWEQLSHSYLAQSISAYVSMVNEPKSTNLQEPWSPDFVALYGQNIYQNMTCMSAFKVIPKTAIVSLVDAVRNKILSFVLEIERENPNAGEAEINSNPIPQEKITQIFNTNVYGNVQNVAAGGTNVTQHGEINIKKFDFESLRSYLKKYEIPDKDINELQEAINQDKTDNPNENEIGNRVTSWITKMLNKCAKGALKISTDIAASILTKAITSYYGIEA